MYNTSYSEEDVLTLLQTNFLQLPVYLFCLFIRFVCRRVCKKGYSYGVSTCVARFFLVSNSPIVQYIEESYLILLLLLLLLLLVVR